MEKRDGYEVNDKALKKLDWYILKKFLGTFVFIMLLLTMITVVIDLTEKIDNFIEDKVTVAEVIFDYFVYFIPFINSLVGPFFILVSVIFFTSQLANRSEIIAILNSGTSFYRFLFPYFIGASLLVALFMYGNHFGIPYANHKRLAFEGRHFSKYRQNLRYSFHQTVAPGVIIYIENYKPTDGTGFKFSIDNFKDGKLLYKLDAEKIDWLPEEKEWRLTNYHIREFGSPRDKLTEGQTLDTTFKFTPNDFSFAESLKEEMTTPELSAYIDKMYESGQKYVEFYEVEYHRRSASALSIYIMTLIGVSLASRKVRGGLGWHLVLGIGLSALYEIISKFSVTFSTNSNLPAIIGTWIPNIIFGTIAIYLFRKAPK